MNKLLKICEAWSTDTGMEFSPTKCMVLIPASTKSNLVPYKIYGNALTAATKVTYLGIDFNAKGICWPELVQRRRVITYSVLQTLKTVRYNMTGFSQASSCSLYKAFLRPSIEHGAALGPSSSIAPSIITSN